MRMQTKCTSQYLQLEHVNLHYLDYGGPGPQTLVLVHGGGANAHWFDFVGPALACYCRVLAVDLRGHGDSSWAEPPVYTFEAYMQDLRTLFQAEHLTAPLLMGHSMGGILLTQYKLLASYSRWDSAQDENTPRSKSTSPISASVLMDCVHRRPSITILPALQRDNYQTARGCTRSTVACMRNAPR